MALEFRVWQKPDGRWLLLDQMHNTYGDDFATEQDAWDWLEDNDEKV